ncbi:MAG: UDP-2,3-diacylglucosamine diphosphatase [Planctomycetota bacterium]|jgi:UDP-2,3-diacylglucosamine hydrolase
MSARGNESGDLVFIGDVHLDRDDPCLEPFLEFLERLSRTSRRIVLMGDLFNLWIGQPQLEQPQQTAVVDKLAELRSRGLSVCYLEGNRDYRIGGYTGRAFDKVSDRGIVESFAGRRIVAIHGDLANPADRQYRTWRRISRSSVTWALLNLLPRRQRLALAHSLERRMRASNVEFKAAFPEDAIRSYAAAMLGPEEDALVLGHFHVEKDLKPAPDGPPARILVLPEWKSTRRHLHVTPAGKIEFVDSTP